MASERQIEANKRNAQRSTGPRSARGKAKSAQNALRHGLAVNVGPEPGLRGAIGNLTEQFLRSSRHSGQSLHAVAAAEAEYALRRVREARVAFLEHTGGDELEKMLVFERYERRALSQRKRALRGLLAPEN